MQGVRHIAGSPTSRSNPLPQICIYCSKDLLESSTVSKCPLCRNANLAAAKQRARYPEKGPKEKTKSSSLSVTREKLKTYSNLRVIQKNLVYVIGLAPDVAKPEVRAAARLTALDPPVTILLRPVR